jgi:TRAP-type mannitol/chloroaromatic compound transport system substrate-binding protein
MDINTIVLIVIVLIIVYAMLNHGNEKKLLAEKEREISQNEKDELSQEDVATYGQVQERKKQLFTVIDDNLSEHPDESAQLKEIIEDWANLKIEAFQNRRSWVRATPDK